MNDVAQLHAEIAKLTEKNRALAEELERVRKENRDFATMYVEVQEQNVAATNLYVASHRLHATLDAKEVLAIIKEILVELIGAEEFGVLLLDKKKRMLELVAEEGVLERLPSRVIPAGEGAVGEVTASGKPCFFERDSAAARNAALPMAAVPLSMDGESVGVIVIYKLLSQKSGFSPIDHQVLELLAAHAATALMSARLHGAIDRKLKTVEGFVQMMKG